MRTLKRATKGGIMENEIDTITNEKEAISLRMRVFVDALDQAKTPHEISGALTCITKLQETRVLPLEKRIDTLLRKM
jgi:hypothetical protein